jgi:hypothetical protein
MAFSHGKDGYWSVNAVDHTSYIVDGEFPETRDMADVSTMGNGAKAFVPGQTGFTITLTYKYDPTPYSQLVALKNSASTIDIIHGPAGNGSGAQRRTGSVFITSINPSTGVGDAAELQVEFQGTGAVTDDTFP